MNYKAMGRLIYAKRRERGFTQEQMADKADLSLSFYGHIERGTRIPSVETLVAIANALDVSTDYLLSNELKIMHSGKNYTKEQISTLREYFQTQQQALLHWDDEPEE